jgi:hypothetical protein
MAAFIDISTLNGSVVAVAAQSVWRITHGGADAAGAVHTQVDFDGGQQLTDGSAATLVAALAAAGVKMLRLAAPDQSTIYLNAAEVTAVAPAMAGVDAPGAQSAIMVAGHRQAVTETPAEVRALL